MRDGDDHDQFTLNTINDAEGIPSERIESMGFVASGPPVGGVGDLTQCYVEGSLEAARSLCAAGLIPNQSFSVFDVSFWQKLNLSHGRRPVGVLVLSPPTTELLERFRNRTRRIVA